MDGRLYADLSTLTPESPLTPVKNFYLRSRASNLLETGNPWTIQIRGLVREPSQLTFASLEAMEKPMGVHLMECAGNTRGFHFGLMSAATWTGVPLSEVLKNIATKPQATRILISGFDKYQAQSATSQPGASWIFKLDELNFHSGIPRDANERRGANKRSRCANPPRRPGLVRLHVHQVGQ